MNKEGGNSGGAGGPARAGSRQRCAREGGRVYRTFFLWLSHPPAQPEPWEEERCQRGRPILPIAHNSALQTFQEDAIQGESPNSGWKGSDLQTRSSISLSSRGWQGRSRGACSCFTFGPGALASSPGAGLRRPAFTGACRTLGAAALNALFKAEEKERVLVLVGCRSVWNWGKAWTAG